MLLTHLLCAIFYLLAHKVCAFLSLMTHLLCAIKSKYSKIYGTMLLLVGMNVFILLNLYHSYISLYRHR